jgi:hypothetical protein
LATVGGHDDLILVIQNSVQHIPTAQRSIDKGSKTIADSTEKVHAAIGRASDDLSALMAQLAMDPGRPRS